MSTELATNEVYRLEYLEDMIDKGMKTFMDVGRALSEIQSAKLYRGQFGSFEDYCKDRWHFSGNYGRCLIEATKVVDEFQAFPEATPIPRVASHAVALSSIPQEHRRDAWMDAIGNADADGRSVSAKDIAAAAENRAAEMNESAGTGNIRETSKLFIELATALRNASQAAEQLQRSSASQWLLLSGSTLLKHIRDARDHAAMAKPHGKCPHCDGASCAKCFETGWISVGRARAMAKPK